MLTTTTYQRIPNPLQVVRVTEANMAEVAGWTDGNIKATDEGRLFIEIDVVKPGNDRQTQAFVGDWVIFSPQGGGFKIYMDRPFQQNFEQVSVEMNFVDVTPKPYVPEKKNITITPPKTSAPKPGPGAGFPKSKPDERSAGTSGDSGAGSSSSDSTASENSGSDSGDSTETVGAGATVE